jgi:HAD superfamily hydrolase (TIGR01509 family)
MLRGVIFDMDGVLVDSEEWICRAGIAMFAEHGVKAQPEDFVPFVGAGENRYLGGVAEKHGFAIDIERDKARCYEIYAEMVAGKLEPLPGVHEFIAKCRQRNLRLALATAADRVKMEVNLREIGLLVESFDAAVNALDVEKKKPDPEIFLLAAERMELPAGDCLVVEDSVNGVAAAKAAGARCLGLTTSFDAGKLSAADWLAPDLSAAPDACLSW